MDTATAPCPSCFADRPYPLTVIEGTFLPGSDCPACGHLEPDLEFEVVPSDGSEDPGFTLTLDADGVITRAPADGVIASIAADGVTAPSTADGDRLDTFRPDDSDQVEEYARYARLMGVDPDLVFAALAGRAG